MKSKSSRNTLPMFSVKGEMSLKNFEDFVKELKRKNNNSSIFFVFIFIFLLLSFLF